jgi:cyclophilin family peptidyl-prolyl cis-trans isomerase
LVGNFGDGHINVYSPNNGTFLGQFKDSGGTPINIDGLWALKFGNGGQAGDPQTLFFSAGRHTETNGFFGTLRITSGIVSGQVFLNSQENGLAGTTVSLTGTPTTGPAIPINLTANTDSSGSFTFSGLPDGQYSLKTGPIADIVGTMSIGSVSASTGVNIVSPFSVNGGASGQQNVIVRGGLDLHFISLEMFLNTSSTAGLHIGTAGAGKPDNTPTVTAPIATQSLSASTTSQTVDLAGHFGLNTITDSAVTMNITAGGASKTIKLNLLDTAAPQTVANFFDYINSGAFNNSFFHRETTAARDGIGVLQGGGAIITNGTGPSVITPVLPIVPDEIGTSNTKGTLAMANTGSANSASDQFFFNVVDNKGLDSKFTVFAKVADADSQAVLDSLGATPVQDLSSHTATITATGATEIGNTVTITTTAAHNFQVGQTAVISGVTNAGYNGSFTILSVTATTFTYTAPTAGLPPSGSGSATASTNFARTSPSLLLNEVPLNGGTVPDFPTDSSKYLVITSITTTKRDDFLTYSIVSNSNPTLVNATLTNEQLTLTRGTGTGTATIIVQANNRFGASVIQTLTVMVA